MRYLALLISISIGLFNLDLYAQSIDLDSLNKNIGAMALLLHPSAIESGIIIFEKKDNYCEYRFNDTETSIRILSFYNENKELVYLDTKSTDISLFGIKVGMALNEIISVLGYPTRTINRNGMIEIEYYGRQYMLILDIAQDRLSRLYYNPFE
jgi:hypothetical protein